MMYIIPFRDKNHVEKNFAADNDPLPPGRVVDSTGFWCLDPDSYYVIGEIRMRSELHDD